MYAVNYLNCSPLTSPMHKYRQMSYIENFRICSECSWLYFLNILIDIKLTIFQYQVLKV